MTNAPHNSGTAVSQSLDFTGCSMLTAAQIAQRTGWSEKHICALITDGELPAVDGRGKHGTRGSYRVPIESYRDFIAVRMTGPRRFDLLLALPKPVLRELLQELTLILQRN